MMEMPPRNYVNKTMRNNFLNSRNENNLLEFLTFDHNKLNET